MPRNGMTPHYSGTTLNAQARYAAGVREVLDASLLGKPIREEFLVVQGGMLRGVGAHSYTASNATEGVE